MQKTDQNLLADGLRRWEAADLAESIRRVPERPAQVVWALRSGQRATLRNCSNLCPAFDR